MSGQVNNNAQILLIADAIHGDAFALKRALEGKGLDASASFYDVTFADTLAKGLGMISSIKIDAVVLDLNLPDCQGLSALVLVHSQSPDTPIIVLVSADEKELGLNAIRSGAHDYIVKSALTEFQLKHAIDCAIERQKLREQMVTTEQMHAVDSMAAGIAHDLENILTAVSVNLSLSKSRIDRNTIEFDRLSLAEEACERGTYLAEQLLKLAADDAEAVKRSILSNFYKDGAKLNLSSSQTECNFSVAQDLQSVEMNGELISQTINDLMILMSSRAGKGNKIFVNFDNVPMGSETFQSLPSVRHAIDYVRIAIELTQNGEPARAAEKEKLYDPLYSEKEHKAILGLSLAHFVVMKHQGFITFRLNESGFATAVSIYLPTSRPVVHETMVAPVKVKAQESVVSEYAVQAPVDSKAFGG